MNSKGFRIGSGCKSLMYFIGLIGLLLAFSCKDENITDNNDEAAARRFATEEIVNITNAAGDTIYTGPRYNRQFQTQVQQTLININAIDIYDYTFFNLDATNTDHFYEDIGKYSKYVFGWVDWYFRFSADESGAFQDPHWVVDGPLDSPNTRWIANYPIWGPDTQTSISPSSSEASSMRTTYLELRE